MVGCQFAGQRFTLHWRQVTRIGKRKISRQVADVGEFDPVLPFAVRQQAIQSFIDVEALHPVAAPMMGDQPQRPMPVPADVGGTIENALVRTIQDH